MSNETANMDFKYVLQDFNNVYIGARLTFAELCEQDDTPQRLRTAVFQYVIPEVGEEIRICDALSSMTKDSKLAMVLKQLRCKIKTVKPKIKVDKKGRSRTEYETEELSFENFWKKQEQGQLCADYISEFYFGKLHLSDVTWRIAWTQKNP